MHLGESPETLIPSTHRGLSDGHSQAPAGPVKQKTGSFTAQGGRDTFPFSAWTGALALAAPRLRGLVRKCHQAAMVVAGQHERRRHTMTDTTTNTTPKAPTHVAYQVRDTKGGKSFWTRIGSAWSHGDGRGFNIQIEAVPLDGRITLRVASEKKE